MTAADPANTDIGRWMSRSRALFWRKRAEVAEAERDRLATLVQTGADIAAHYMDTDGRGDLDGWVDAARAALARTEQP